MGHVTGVKWGVVAPEDVGHGLCNIFFQKVSCTVHAWKCHIWVQALFDLGVPLIFFCIHVLNVFKIKDHSCCTHAAFMSHACCIHVTCMHHEGLLPSIFHACETGSRFADMAHFEQAALLATAWANDDKIQAMALRHAIVEVSKNKRLKRSRILSEILASKANVLKIMHVSDAIPSQVM